MRPFCRENMDYITEDINYIPKMNDVVKNAKLSGIHRMIEWKYFHPNHPENHNIKNYNEQTNMVEYYDGKGWKTDSIQTIVELILNRIGDDIDNFIGYTKHEKLNIDTKHFASKIASPLDLDMMYIEYNEIQNDFTKEKKRNAIFTSIETFLKKKLTTKKKK